VDLFNVHGWGYVATIFWVNVEATAKDKVCDCDDEHDATFKK
jgi:hypothetical protein